MRIVFLSGKFRAPKPYGIELNCRAAEDVSLEISKIGAVALAPHLLSRHFQGSLPDQFWIDGAIELMKRCDAVFMIPGWENSSGSIAERQIALDRGMPVFEDYMRLQEWLNTQ